MGAARQILEIMKDGKAIDEIAVDREGMLGRGDECLVRLNDQAISRNHLWLKPVEGGVQLEKRSEFAPFKVNGQDLTRTLLKMGDIIELGRYRIQLKSPESPVESSELEQKEIPPAPSSGGTELFAPPIGMDVNPDSISTPLITDSPADLHVPESSLQVAVNEESATQISDLSAVDCFLDFPPGVANVAQKALVKEEITLGRDATCDVVLLDKKASRNHALVRKAGLRFTIKDLGSANGVYVNGSKIDEVELNSDDQIQIGDSSFHFRAVQKGFEQIAATIEPVVEESMSAPSLALGSQSVNLEQPAPASQGFGFQQPEPQHSINSIPVAGAMAGAMPSFGSEIGAGVLPQAAGKQTLLEKFRALPPRRQVIWAVVIAALFYFLFIEEDEVPVPTKKPVTAQEQKAKPKAVDAQSSEPSWKQEFLGLSPEQQAFVKGQIAKAQEMIRVKNYDLAIDELRQAKIYAPHHEEILTLEKFALGEIDRIKVAQEEERKKAELEAVKRRLADLLEESTALMKAKKYSAAQKLFPEIQQLDPENADVSKWSEEIQDHDAKIAEQKRVAEVKRIANEDAKNAFAAALAWQEQGRYFKAIEAYNDPKIAAAPDQSFAERAKTAIQECLSKVDELRQPLMAEAKQFEDLQNFKSAYESYKKALAIDQKFPPAKAGMERSRKSLQAKAKEAYVDAVLAESYSDYDMAVRKYQEVLTIVPEDDLYFERATRKLGRLSFHKPASEAVPQ